MNGKKQISKHWNFKPWLLLLAFTGLIGAAIFFPLADGFRTQAVTAKVLHMHGNPTDDVGCTGTGNTDVSNALCLGGFGPGLLDETARPTLGTGTAAHWNVANPALDGTGDRNNINPNWVWKLPGKTTLGGDMALQWWAACAVCTGSFGTAWQIRVWADGVKRFEQRVVPNRDNSNPLPDVPKLNGITIFLHENFPNETTNTIVANNTIVLQINPVFIDTQNNTNIFYDSVSPCPGSPASNTAPCDSKVTMPVLATGEALPTPTPTPAPVPAAVQGSGPAPRFQDFYPPLSMIAAGVGVDAGEPSIGVNWKTNRAMYISDLTTLRVTFNDSCATTPSATWEDKSAPNNATSLDPILFTDHGYSRTAPNVGRTFVSELTGQDSLSSFTDNDGDTWTPGQGGGIPSGVDHQTVGAGPFHTPLVGTVYPNAVYYCSQDIASAFCARSDDGGATFGAGVPAWDLTSCGGLHGHVKVAPDGTVYVPNKSCLGKQAVVVSEDNGATWSIRAIPNTIKAGSDPTVGIGSGGRVYIAFANNDAQAAVAVSDDRGQTWPKVFDVGASAGIKAVAFPEMVAGDNDRAAAAFLGSTTAATSTISLQDRLFPGFWHLYVMTTYNGGATWVTSDATPNDVVQRGGIWLGGGSPVQRNLLDFMGIDVDKDGRILVGYADGCTGPSCVRASASATGNSYTELAAIARQTGGLRLFAAGDPVGATTPTVPGAPLLTVGRDGNLAHLTWSESDDGGSPITNYSVKRGTTSGGETLLADIGGRLKFDDPTADPNVTYFYTVTATNLVGTSCGSNEVRAAPIGDSSSGLTVVIDPTGDQSGAPANADLDIQEIRLGDVLQAGKSKVVFQMKVADLRTLMPDRQWRIIFSYPKPPDTTTPFTGTYYVGMNTDSASATSFEYGTVTTVETVPANTSSPNKIGAADSGSVDQAKGIITIVLSADKIGGPKAGDLLGLIIGRTFAGNGNQTLRSNAAIDRTSGLAAQDPYTGASYLLVASSLQFSSATYSVGKADQRVNLSVTRLGDTSGAATVRFATIDDAGLKNCNVFNGIASQRCDYEITIGMLTFAAGETSKSFSVAIINHSYAKGNQTFRVALSNASGASLGTPSIATVTITDSSTVNGPNPIDDTNFFVRQQYLDFLGREPDPPGFAGWVALLNTCMGDTTQCDRVHVSESFFKSPEFQQRGFFVYRFYSVSFGRKPDYAEFMPDLAGVSGFLSDAQLEAAKVAFINQFMARSAFVTKYNSLSNTQYVDTLLSTAGVILSSRQSMIDGLNNGTLTRAQVLRQIAESTEVANKYFNQAFAVMEYFGYLRRDPDAAYLVWIQELDQGSDSRHMVTGFVNSTEYRQRFGPP